MEIWERIEALVGDDCGFTCEGQVLVAETEAELASFRERVEMHISVSTLELALSPQAGRGDSALQNWMRAPAWMNQMSLKPPGIWFVESPLILASASYWR
jgi:hypothetical protein